MKVKNRWCYDNYYDLPIGEWEDYLRYTRLSDRRMTWYKGLFLPFLAMGIGFAGLSWRGWLGIAAIYYVFVNISSFLEEINENIRYTRHKVAKEIENRHVEE
jgi:hypothetical protein